MQLYFQTQDANKVYYGNGKVQCSVNLDLTNNLNAVENIEKLKKLKGFEIL